MGQLEAQARGPFCKTATSADSMGAKMTIYDRPPRHIRARGRPEAQAGGPLRKAAISAGPMVAKITHRPTHEDQVNRSLTAQYLSPNHRGDLFQAVDRQGKTELGPLQQGYGPCHGQSQTASLPTSPATGARYALAPCNDSLKQNEP